MRNMDEAIQEFINAIKGTKEYLDYTGEKNKVKQFPELKMQIDEYRRRSYELQSNDEIALQTMEQFEEEYADFRGIPMVEDFLAAELALCRLMQKVNLKVTESLEFE